MPRTGSSTRCLLVLALIALLAAGAALAQRRSGGKPAGFSDATSVVSVEVPVSVTRGGEPVTNLSAENFELLDGKQKQQIRGFEIIDLDEIDGVDPAVQRMSTAARRHLFLLFDLAFSEPESVVRARHAARDLLASLHPSDLATVGVYTSGRGAVPLMSFTSDRRQLAAAIETLGLPDLGPRARDPLGLVFRPLDHEVRIDDEQVLEALGRLNATDQALQLDRLGAFKSNFEDLAGFLGPLEGQKHVVFFSEGIPANLVVGNTNTLAMQQRRANFRAPGASAELIFGRTEEQDRLEDMIRAFVDASCAIQAVDIGDVRTAIEMRGRQSGEDSLITIAKNTGGEFFRSFKNLGEAMGKVFDQSRIQYLLSFQPTDLQHDGEYHRLRVKLKDVPRGKVTHRSGYFAPGASLGASRQRLEIAALVMGSDGGGSLEIDALATPVPVAGARAYVPVLFELEGKNLLAAPAGEELLLEVYGYATDTSTGTIHDYFVEQVRGDARELRQRSGMKYWGHFDLPAGRYTARLMVREPRSGRYGVIHRAITVAAADGGKAHLLPPLFPEHPHKWVMLREPPERRRTDIPYPFLLADGNPYVPAARPVVPAKGTTPFLLWGFHLQGGFEGRVVSAQGRPVKKAKLRFDRSSEAAGGVMAWLETKGLKPGPYTLIGRAAGAAGEKPSSSIRFVVE